MRKRQLIKKIAKISKTVGQTNNWQQLCLLHAHKSKSQYAWNYAHGLVQENCSASTSAPPDGSSRRRRTRQACEASALVAPATAQLEGKCFDCSKWPISILQARGVATGCTSSQVFSHSLSGFTQCVYDTNCASFIMFDDCS